MIVNFRSETSYEYLIAQVTVTIHSSEFKFYDFIGTIVSYNVVDTSFDERQKILKGFCGFI